MLKTKILRTYLSFSERHYSKSLMLKLGQDEPPQRQVFN